MIILQVSNFASVAVIVINCILFTTKNIPPYPAQDWANMLIAESIKIRQTLSLPCALLKGKEFRTIRL